MSPEYPEVSAPPNVTLEGCLVGSFPRTRDAIRSLIFPAFASWSTYDCYVPEDIEPRPITPDTASRLVAFVITKNYKLVIYVKSGEIPFCKET